MLIPGLWSFQSWVFFYILKKYKPMTFFKLWQNIVILVFYLFIIDSHLRTCTLFSYLSKSWISAFLSIYQYWSRECEYFFCLCIFFHSYTWICMMIANVTVVLLSPECAMVKSEQPWQFEVTWAQQLLNVWWGCCHKKKTKNKKTQQVEVG